MTLFRVLKSVIHVLIRLSIPAESEKCSILKIFNKDIGSFQKEKVQIFRISFIAEILFYHYECK